MRIVPVILFSLLILLVASVAFSGYIFLQNQKLLTQLLQRGASPSPNPSLQASPEPSASPSPSPATKHTLSEVQENIEAAINSKNTQALVGYMAKPKINFIIMSSSCCEPMAADDAVAKLDYVKDGIPFDFDQNTTTVKNLKSKNERLAQAYIGLSKNKEHLAAFTIDSNNQITQIEVSISYKLYNQ